MTSPRNRMPLNNQGMMSIIPLDTTFQVIKGAGQGKKAEVSATGSSR